MKKTAALFAITALCAAPAFAAQTGGFVEPNASSSSAHAKSADGASDGESGVRTK